jgi:hypothetical protein
MAIRLVEHDAYGAPVSVQLDRAAMPNTSRSSRMSWLPVNSASMRSCCAILCRRLPISLHACEYRVPDAVNVAWYRLGDAASS